MAAGAKEPYLRLCDDASGVQHAPPPKGFETDEREARRRRFFDREDVASQPYSPAASQRVDEWMAAIPEEELRTVNAHVFLTAKNFLTTVQGSILGGAPVPSFLGDESLAISWDYQDHVISVSIDEDSQVEWWVCNRNIEGRADPQRDLISGSYSAREDREKSDELEELSALDCISKALRACRRR